MKVEVLLTNNFNLLPPPSNVNFSNTVCLVIDVLRATSTIATLLGVGVERILIARTKKQAFKLKKIFSDYILCGEEKGLPPRGFDFGNSPFELSNLDLKGKRIILKTTNGTVSFFKAKDAKVTFSLSILNMKYTMDCAVSYAQKNSCDILILCSGREGNIAYDDAYTAGVAVKYLLTKPVKNLELQDSAKLVLSVCLGEKSIESALEKSYSGVYVRRIGLGKDNEFCAKLNSYNVTGRLKIEKFKLDSRSEFSDYSGCSRKIQKNKNSQHIELLVLEPFVCSDYL